MGFPTATALAVAAALISCLVVPGSGQDDDNVVTHFCCRMPDFSSEWCHRGDCYGGDRMGCASNSTPCADIGRCICAGRIGYNSRTSCNIMGACNNAERDLRRAEIWVEKNIGSKLDDIPECRESLFRVICAYHFPSCTSDQETYPQICYDTCYGMYDACVQPTKCKEGTNTTLKDDLGNVILDPNGNPQVVPCSQNRSTTDDAIEDGLGLANDAGNAISDVAGDVGNTLSGAGSSAADAVADGMGTGTRRRLGGADALEVNTDLVGFWYDILGDIVAYARTEMARISRLRRGLGLGGVRVDQELLQQREQLLQGIISSGDDRGKEPGGGWRPVYSHYEEEEMVKQAMGTRQGESVLQGADLLKVGTPSENRERRKVVQTGAGPVYFEFEPGKIKLVDFAQVGSRCNQCLNAKEISQGYQCTERPPSAQYKKANSECTSGATSLRPGQVGSGLAVVLTAAIASLLAASNLNF